MQHCGKELTVLKNNVKHCLLVSLITVGKQTQRRTLFALFWFLFSVWKRRLDGTLSLDSCLRLRLLTTCSHTLILCGVCVCA